MPTALIVGDALEKGARFLLGAQSPDGAWRDFDLKPGRSEAWVTSYAGTALVGAAATVRGVNLAAALAGARTFIDAARDPRGGWGYNSRCDPDADSTARTILFLRAIDAPLPLRDYAALAKFQLESGDFSTYRAFAGRPGWCAGHPDVTVVALRALLEALPPGHVILRRGRARLARYVRETSSTASYWWPSPLYMAKELLLLQREDAAGFHLLLPRSSIPSDDSCFDAALALEIGVLRGAPQEKSFAKARRLASRQNSDGSWPTSPLLRITDPLSTQPGDRRFRSSEIASDDRRIFTTATVMSALRATVYGSSASAAVFATA
jgi:hypothetical protein